jgi:hypothetical protein
MGIASSLNQIVTIAARTGFTNGIPTYGAAVSVAARVEPHSRMILSLDGSLHESVARIFLPTGTTVLSDAKMTLPDGETPEVLEVKHIFARTVEHHVEVIVGSRRDQQ